MESKAGLPVQSAETGGLLPPMPRPMTSIVGIDEQLAVGLDHMALTSFLMNAVPGHSLT